MRIFTGVILNLFCNLLKFKLPFSPFKSNYYQTLLFAFSLSISLPSVLVYGQGLENENRIIEDINITVHGDASSICDTKAIVARLHTQPNGMFSQGDFDEDLKLLAQDFDRVEPQIETVDEKLIIGLHLWTKPIIRTISWCGNHGLKTTRLQKELNIACFSPFDKPAFNEAFHKIKAYYIQEGFFEANLTYQVELNEELNEVSIIINIDEGRVGRVQEIVFVNFTDKEKCEILLEMVTKKYNLFTSWYTHAGTYNEDAVEQDRMVITNYLQNQGYADAQVSVEVSEGAKSHRIIVVITADKGQLYTFGQVSFEGNKVFDDECITELFSAIPCQPFSLDSIRDTIEAITDKYGRLGYVDTNVNFDQELMDCQTAYRVNFKIEEGAQYSVGLIRIFGNTVTKDSVILHETLLTPGEIFNTIKLKATQARLANIGYFKSVNVYIVKGSESNLGNGNYRDVYIEVEETDTGQFSAFFGFSTVEELFGGMSITEKNFNYAGISRSWKEGLRTLRGGGEYLQLNLQIGQKSRTYGLSWTKPHFMDTRWSVGFDLTNATTRYISNKYDLETSSLVLRAHYDYNQFVRFGLQYRLKNGFVDLQENASCISELEHDAHIHGLISAVGGSIGYDSTDHSIKASRGFRSKLLLEYAGIGGDHKFFNLGYFNSYYLPIGSRLVVKYRADFRFIQPLGTTSYYTMPMDERIFLGGDFCVRGFRPYRLGPHYRHHPHIPRGGLSMQFYSVEMVRRIMQDLEVYAFLDAGHLSKDTWEFGRMSVSIGYGCRFKLIDSIPPVSLGMGYPLNAHSHSDVKKFFFSFGGNF